LTTRKCASGYGLLLVSGDLTFENIEKICLSELVVVMFHVHVFFSFSRFRHVPVGQVTFLPSSDNILCFPIHPFPG